MSKPGVTIYRALFGILLVAVAGQPRAVPAAPSPAPTQATPWTVGWETAATKVFRAPKTFHGHSSDPVQMALAKNEYESVQLVLLGGSQPAHVKVSVGPIVHTDGTGHFPPDAVEVRQVGYVTTRKPYYPVPFIGEWPDPLPLAQEVDVPANGVQPMWITLGAPEQLRAGRYAGTVTLTDASGRTEEMALHVQVWDFSLPRTSHLKTAFGFYRNRLVSAYHDFVPQGMLWTGRTDELEGLYDLELLKHRMSPMLDADPFRDGATAQLTRYRQVGLSAFGLGTHGGNYDNDWPTDPRQWKRLSGWYREASRAVREAGLDDLAYVYAYDEPHRGDPRVPQALSALHHADARLRTLLVMQ